MNRFVLLTLLLVAVAGFVSYNTSAGLTVQISPPDPSIIANNAR